MRTTVRLVGVFAAVAYLALSMVGSAQAQNNALDFAPGATADASDAYVSFGATSALGLSTFTIETWFKREGTGVANSTGSGGIASLIPLISKGAPQADGAGCPTGDGRCDANYVLGISTAGNVLAADFEDKATGPESSHLRRHAHSDRHLVSRRGNLRWHHVAPLPQWPARRRGGRRRVHTARRQPAVRRPRDDADDDGSTCSASSTAFSTSLACGTRRARRRRSARP